MSHRRHGVFLQLLLHGVVLSLSAAPVETGADGVDAMA
jgi:hypothetical protein